MSRRIAALLLSALLAWAAGAGAEQAPDKTVFWDTEISREDTEVTFEGGGYVHLPELDRLLEEYPNLKKVNLWEKKLFLKEIPDLFEHHPEVDFGMTIELNKWSREILARYNRPDAPMKVFPRITNQVMNRAVKEICKACEVTDPVRLTRYKGGQRIDETHPKWELIGTHAARRTFVVNALQMGISPTIVMKWTGHASYDSMKPYIAVADSARAQAMAGFDRLEKAAPATADGAAAGATES